MSKQKYNIEHKNYAIKVMEWFYSIETDFDPDKHEVGESNYSIVVNTAPFKSMIVDLTRVNGKVAVAQAIHTKPTIKVYYPKHVEKSFHDYDETGKYMYAAKGLLWLGMIEVAASKDYKPGIWKTDVLDLRYQLFRVAGLSGFTKKALVDLSTAFGSTIRFEVVNPNSPRRIVVVKEIPISEIGNLNTFITDPNEDLWEIKKAKEDYYINKLMSLETGSLMKDATVWFDNKSMPLDTFKAKCLGQILLTGPYKVYIKRTGTQVDKLNTCNMSVTSYTITYK